MAINRSRLDEFTMQSPFQLAGAEDERNQTQPVGGGFKLGGDMGQADQPMDWTEALQPAAKGSWNANFEWEPAQGGPQISDLLGSVGDTSRLTGFNTQGWGSGGRGTESEKNAVGMILSRIDPSQGNAIDAFLSQPEVQQFWPDAVKVGFDKVDLDGAGPRQPVDLLRNASASTGGGDAWQYLVPGSGGGGGVQQAQSLGPGGNDIMAALFGGGGAAQSDSLLQQIQAELQKMLSGGQPSTVAPEAV